jgi:beta-lactam-binding protein with PASTA domain
LVGLLSLVWLPSLGATDVPSSVVDDAVAVPDVELTEVAEALATVRAAGLVPVLIDLSTYGELAPDGLEDEVVLRQGIAGDERTPRGEQLLLGVRPRASSRPITADSEWLSPTDADGPVTALPEVPAAETNEQLGYVGLTANNPQASLTTSDGTAWTPTDESLSPLASALADDVLPPNWESLGGALEDVGAQPPLGSGEPYNDGIGGLATGLPVGGLATGELSGLQDLGPAPGLVQVAGDSAVQDAMSGIVDLSPGLLSSTTGPALIVPFPSVIGVSLDPTASPDQRLLAVLLRAVIQAILLEFKEGQPQSPIGLAIVEAVKQHEVELTNALLLSGDPAPLPIEKIVLITTRHLGIAGISPDKVQEAAAAWRVYAAARPHPALLDVSHNGIVCDDIVVWLACWFFQQQLYSPASQMSVQIHPLTKLPFAVVSAQPVDPAWVGQLAGLIPQLLDSSNNSNAIGPAKPSVTGPNGTSESPSLTTASGEQDVQVAAGKPLVEVASSADLIRIPTGLKGKLASDAAASILKVGLDIERNRRLFRSDKVVATKPDEGTWIAPSQHITLHVARKVRRVENQQVQQAIKTLKEQDFVPQPRVRQAYKAGDMVVAQEAPGADDEGYLKLGGAVVLEVQRPVPKVEGLNLKDALALLVDREKFQFAGVESPVFADVIQEQDPPYHRQGAPSLAEVGSAVKAKRLRTPVPDLPGKSLLEARTYAETWKLLSELRLNLKQSGVTTRLPAAKVLSQSPPANTLVDRSREHVEIQLVVPVPELASATTTIAQARQKLHGRDLKAEVETKNFREDDRVLKYRAMAETVSAGATAYVKPGTIVRLAAGRQVPDLARRTWRDAETALAQRGLRSTPPAGESAGSQVFEVPAAGTLVDPDQPVILVPGERIPPLEGRTFEDADRLVTARGLRLQVSSSREIETRDPRLVDQIVVRSQSPPADELVRRRAGTSVQIDTLVHVVKMPPLINATIEQAEAALRTLPIRLQPQHDARFSTDLVLNQEPLAGARLSATSRVTLVAGVVLPNLVGHTPEQVDQLLRSYGLRGAVSHQTKRVRDRAQVGSICTGQFPQPGRYPRESLREVKVELTTNQLDLRPVPDVDDRWPVAQAMATVFAAGFNLGIQFAGRTYAPADFLQALQAYQQTRQAQANRGAFYGATPTVTFTDPVVVSQSPAPRTPYLAGSVVLLTVEVNERVNAPRPPQGGSGVETTSPFPRP